MNRIALIRRGLSTLALWRGIVFIKMLMLSGCSIKGSFQGLYSYLEKTNKMAPLLLQKPNTSVCDLAQSDSAVVFLVNGLELKKCLESHEKSLVYLWRPRCSSDVCISPGIMQSFCRKNGIELFVVAEYYDSEMMSLLFPIQRPLLGIDCDYYSSHLTRKYVSRFLRDVLESETVTKGNYCFLFHHGCLVSMSAGAQGLRM